MFVHIFLFLNRGSNTIWGKAASIRESNQGLGVYKENFAKYHVPKRPILLAGTGVWKKRFCSMWVYSDYPKSLISRINEVYVFFNKISL